MIVTPAKRKSLIQLGIATGVLLLAFWFILIGPAQARVSQKAKTSSDLATKIAAKKKVIQHGAEISTRLHESSRELQEIENQMVSGDSYRWIIKTLRDFEIPHQLEFSRYDPPQFVESDTRINLPYQIVSYAVTGSATYHDFGAFVKRFENTYPHIRIHRLELEPATVGISLDEKLLFLLELRVLVKPERGVISSSKPGS